MIQHTGMRAGAAALALALMVGCVGGDDAPRAPLPEETVQAREQPIVGGDLESGYPAVGALTFRFPGYGYLGSFCTGTLIEPDWVLTAAHCLTEHEEFDLTPDIVLFHVGDDARPVGNGNFPSGGDFYQAQRFVIHPGYNDRTLADDIGLIQLAEPVTGVTPYPYNTLNLRNYVGSDIFYVGFGVTDGVNQNGGGLKRSTFVELSQVNSTTYYGEYDGSGTCFGDSGGPGLLQLDGQTRIVGVNSAVSGSGRDPCRGLYISTRVDAYATWIAEEIGATPPDCRQQPNVCSCADACQANGTCDNTACQVLSCDEVYDCFVDCGQDVACSNDCYFRGTDAARGQLDTMLGCFNDRCGNVSDAQFQTCIQNNCSTQLDACFPRMTGALSCDVMYSCLVDCGQDESCQTDCFNQGTAQAQDQLIAMNTCFDDRCGNIADEDAFLECATANCSGEIEACFPSDNCAITGGDCPGGTACYPTSTGSTNCVESDGAGLDQPCDPNLADRLSCGDGLICLEASGGGGACAAFCSSDRDCPSGLACAAPIFQGIDDLGVCLEPCTDADGDGVCVEDDCDDNDPNASPSAPEVCGDNVDNNCDSRIDEGCEGCVDNDRDGFCADTNDCDDANAAINPAAAEACGDNIDNNCNDLTDEGCENCVDEDRDGFCAGTTDCNDADPAASPALPEVCGDNIDNNCNSFIDEQCDGSSGDGDGGLLGGGGGGGSPGLLGGGGGGGTNESACSVASPAAPSRSPLGWMALALGLIGVAARRR